jgi:hypothetical protein
MPDVAVDIDTFSPYVILNDCGGAFAMGAIGGAIWHGVKGLRNAPRVPLTCQLLFSHIVSSRHFVIH